MNEKQSLSLERAIELLTEMQRRGANQGREWRICIRKHNPGGMTAHQTTDAVAVHMGFDWEAGRIVFEPARPMTELSPEDVEAIHKSVRAGSSWHAYKAQERTAERLLKARTALIKISQGRDTLSAAEMADIALEGQRTGDA